MNLSDYLEEYKALTLEIMDRIQLDGNVKFLISKRETILNLINEHNFDEEEIKKTVSSLKLLELEEKLESEIKSERIKVKNKIENLKKTRQANANYNKIEYRARVFNKTI